MLTLNMHDSVDLCPDGATVPQVLQVRGGAHVQHRVTCRDKNTCIKGNNQHHYRNILQSQYNVVTNFMIHGSGTP